MVAPWSCKVHISFMYCIFARLCSSFNSGLNTARLSFPFCFLNHQSKLHLFKLIVGCSSTVDSKFIWEATSVKVASSPRMEVARRYNWCRLVGCSASTLFVWLVLPLCLLLNIFKAEVFNTEALNCLSTLLIQICLLLLCIPGHSTPVCMQQEQSALSVSLAYYYSSPYGK